MDNVLTTTRRKALDYRVCMASIVGVYAPLLLLLTAGVVIF